MALTRRLNDYLIEFYKTQKTALLLTGARQTGKTYAIRQFGKQFRSFIEINFIEHPEAVELFKDVTSADDILLRISAISNKPLYKGETLIFFDEVQCSKNIMTAIKFLVDDGRYRYALSGSLLGVELSDIRSMPVGYLGVKEVFPLDFEEFALNLGVVQSVLDSVHDSWKNCEPVDSIVHEKLLSLYKLYTIVGGMPAVVDRYVSTNNLQVVMQTQNDIVELYRRDISQYALTDKLKIKEIYDLIPSELDAKNKRFILKRLNENAKFDRYQNDFLWLKNAGVAIPVYNLAEPRMPLKLNETRNLFKLFSNDVGLLASQYADGIQMKILSGDVSVNFGAIYENVVAQELLCHGYNPYYFNSKRQGEIDFVIADSNGVVPVEVKSGKDYERHNALTSVLATADYGIEKAYVLCHSNMERRGKIVYIPIYMTMYMRRETSSGLGTYTVDLQGLR